MARIEFRIPEWIVSNEKIKKTFNKYESPERLGSIFHCFNLDYSNTLNVFINSYKVDKNFNPVCQLYSIQYDIVDMETIVVFTFEYDNIPEYTAFCVNAKEYIRSSTNKENAYMKNMIVPPKIADIDFFNEKDGLPTIKLTFTDGTHTTATCSEADIPHFSFEQGVGICLGKKMLGPAYNRLIEKGCKMYFRKVEARQKAVEEERRQKDILAKKKAKRDTRIARRKEKQRQEKIDILVEAIRKAKPGMYTVEDVEKSTEIITDAFKNWVGMAKNKGTVVEEKKCGPSRKEKVLYLRELGHTYKEIAKELEISKTTVGRIIRESNND